MKRTALAIAAILLGFSTSARAEAPWQTCPSPGTSCADGRDCVSANCTATVDGVMSSEACNVCVSPLDPDCVGKEPGTSCGEGMVCVVRGCGEGGGTTDGSESYQLSYSCPACSPIGDGDAGGPDATAGLSNSDDSRKSTDTDEDSEGCSVGAVGPKDGGSLLAWVVAGLLLVARKRGCRRVRR